MCWEFYSWVAQVIETVVVVALAPVAVWQFILQRKTTGDQTTATLNQIIATIISWVQAEEIRASRHLLYTNETELSISRLSAKKWKDDWKQAADRVSQAFNSAAIVAQQDTRLQRIWMLPTKNAILKTWSIVQPRIHERRQEEPGLWREFEWLAKTAREL
jgi:hypothetical protein